MTALRVPATRFLSQLSTTRQGLWTASQALSHERHFDLHARRHCERRLVPYAPHKLYQVVSDVNAYKDFVPWCLDSKVTRRMDKNHMMADLTVGFGLFSEKYTSLITLQEAKSVQVDVPNSNLFDYLINDWTFEKGTDPNTTRLSFSVEFRFQSPFYQRVTDAFFEKVAKRMVHAFEKRADLVYGRKD